MRQRPLIGSERMRRASGERKKRGIVMARPPACFRFAIPGEDGGELRFECVLLYRSNFHRVNRKQSRELATLSLPVMMADMPPLCYGVRR
jgi:hypothetical protein